MLGNVNRIPGDSLFAIQLGALVNGLAWLDQDLAFHPAMVTGRKVGVEDRRLARQETTDDFSHARMFRQIFHRHSNHALHGGCLVPKRA